MKSDRRGWEWSRGVGYWEGDNAFEISIIQFIILIFKELIFLEKM